MAVIPIYNCFHPVLQQKTEEIKNIDGRLKKLVDNMYDTMRNIDTGVGLAGNQVGANKSVIVMDLSVAGEVDEDRSITMINPAIEHFSDETIEDLEGCLSVPEYFEKVIRPAEIQVRYLDIDGNQQIEQADGFFARLIQHEVDHLNGIIFIDRIASLKKALAKSKFKRILKGKVPVDYPMILPDGTLQK